MLTGLGQHLSCCKWSKHNVGIRMSSPSLLIIRKDEVNEDNHPHPQSIICSTNSQRFPRSIVSYMILIPMLENNNNQEN